MTRREKELLLRRQGTAIAMLRRKGFRSIGFGGGGDPMQSIASNFQFWSDGTIAGNLLLDKSGNNRHGTLTSNLISNADAVLGSTFIQQSGTAPSSNTSVNTTPPSGFTGQYYSKMQWTVAAGSGIVRTESLILLASETGYVDFWAKRVTNTAFFIGLQPGNGGALLWQLDLSNASSDTYLIEGSRAVGNWGHYRRAFTNTNPGGLADLRVQVLTGTHDIEIFIPPVYNSAGQDYGGVTITSQQNIGFSLPVDATLAATDTKKNFYSATTGFPLVTRAAYQWNAFTRRIYCGGAFKYVFMNADPTQTQHNIIHNNFEDSDFEFTSVPTRLTVGSGKTYATPNAGFNGARAGTFRDRACLDLYDNFSPSTYAEYTVNAAGFMCYIQMNKEYCYMDGSTGPGGRCRIIATKQASLSDAQLSQTEVLQFVYNGGVRNIDFEKYNGGYLLHDDASSTDRWHSMVNCTAIERGAQQVFTYRTDNAQPQPAVQMSFNTWAGGFQNGLIVRMVNSTLNGMRPYTWQDASVSNGNGAWCMIDGCTLQAEIIYDPVSNPLSELKEDVRITSSGGTRNSKVYQSRTTPKPANISKVYTVESIFITEQ